MAGETTVGVSDRPWYCTWLWPCKEGSKKAESKKPLSPAVPLTACTNFDSGSATDAIPDKTETKPADNNSSGQDNPPEADSSPRPRFLGLCECKENPQDFTCLETSCENTADSVTAEDIAACLGFGVSESNPTQMTISYQYSAQAGSCFEEPKLSANIKGKQVAASSFPCNASGADSIKFCVPANTSLNDIFFGLTSGDWCASVIFTSLSIENNQESCNGADDDCDGPIDEGFDIGKECKAGTGSCIDLGHYACAPDGKSSVCDASPLLPSDEICDGIDNDCDGKTDEPESLCGCEPGYVGDNCEKASVSACDCKANPQYFTCLPKGTCDLAMEIDGNDLATCLNQSLTPGSWVIHYQFKGDGNDCDLYPPQLRFSSKGHSKTIDLLPCPGSGTGKLNVCITPGADLDDISLSLSTGAWCSSLLITGIEPASEALCEPTQNNQTNWQNNGLTFTAYLNNQYCTPAFYELLQDAWLAGADTVGLLYTRYQDNLTANEIKINSEKTPSLDSLTCAIEAAKDLNLKVALYLYIESFSGGWRAKIDPSNETVWFNSFGSYLTEMAGFANEHGIDLLSVGAELHSMTKPEHLVQWQNMIAAVRNEYKGPVLYFPNQSNFPELDMGYWQLFDAIGLTFWGSLLNNAVPTVSDLANAWEPYQGMILNKATATNKKIFFGEIGYPSREFCADDPFACNKDGSVYNADCQDNAYQAFYQVWGKSSQVMGALFWQIGLGEKGYDKSMCSEDSIGCCPMKQSTQETIDEWM